MKKTTKIISMILALVMMLSVIPMTASAKAIPDSVNTVEKLIQLDNVTNLLEYLVKKINANKNDLIPTALRIVYLAMNNEQINGHIKTVAGTKDVSLLDGNETSKVLVKWLDTDILPPLQEKLASSGAIATINDNVPGLTIDIHSVQSTFNTLAQLDDTGLKILISTFLGDAKEINVSAVKNVTVAGNEFGAVKALIQFVEDNLPVIRKALNGNLSLGIVDNFFDINDTIGFLGQLPQLIKSYIYKLIDSDAAAGEFADGKMGGDWAKSAYSSYTADQLLAVALIKLIKGDDAAVSQADAQKALNLSFYGLLTEYGPALYSRFAVKAINDNLQSLIDKLPAEARKEFKATLPTVDENTFADIFAGAEGTGILGQLNNILVKIAEMIFTPATYNSLGLVKGGNDKLNANVTKICRAAIPVLVKCEADMQAAFGYTLPDSIKNADPAKLELTDMAVAILKPFFSGWFGGNAKYDASLVDAADSLPDLAMLAVYYTATNTEWIKGEYTYEAVTAKMLSEYTASDATKYVLKTAAGMAISTLQAYAENIHFTVASLDADWEKAFDQIANWGLNFINGLPAVAKAHNLVAQDGYGGFYKLNVILNELIDFSFLNDVSSVPFKLDLGVLLKDAVIGNVYEFDLAGIIGIFEKNNNADNILGKPLNSSLIGIVNRIITALFEHDHGGDPVTRTSDPVPAEGKKQCTHQVTTKYVFCKTCGAYYEKPVVTETKLKKDTHNWKTTNETRNTTEPTKTTCNFYMTIDRECTKCGTIERGVKQNAPTHKWDKTGEYPVCTVCGYELKPDAPTYTLGDVDGKDGVTAADARLALRAAVGLEKYEKGSREFLAADVDLSSTLTAADARLILRKAVKLVDKEWGGGQG